MRLCALLIQRSLNSITRSHNLVIWCPNFFMYCFILVMQSVDLVMHSFHSKGSLYCAPCIHSLHVLFICTLSMRSFHVLFQCVLLMWSLYVLSICTLFMCSLYALFICALYMRSLHALFLCALHMRSLIVHAQAMFITDKYSGWKNGGSSKEVRFKDLSRKVHTGKNLCRHSVQVIYSRFSKNWNNWLFIMSLRIACSTLDHASSKEKWYQ